MSDISTLLHHPAMGDDAGAPGAASAGVSAGLALLATVPVRLSVEVGAASLRLAEVLALEPGGVVTLDRMADEPLDIKVNGTLIARGDIVVAEGRFGVRIVDVVADTALPPTTERRS